MLGFELLEEVKKDELDFQEHYKSYLNPIIKDRNPWKEYMLQDGVFFKGS